MATRDRPEVILGAGTLGSGQVKDLQSAEAYCDLFHQHGHTRIDHARIYPPDTPGRAEEMMRDIPSIPEWAVFDTKITDMGGSEHAREKVAESIDGSLAALGAPIDVLYLHMPSPTVPFEETMEAADRAYRDGKFKRLGLSNQSPAQVEQLVAIAEEKGYVKPSVYQGHYNPICRTGEAKLLPVLRKHGIAFLAFTPTGAGIFSGKVTPDSIHNPDGRWSHTTSIGQYWSSVYLRPELLEASKKLRQAAESVGISGHEAALRWVLHHSVLDKSLGDGMIIGASSLEQLRENMDACDGGPLPPELVKAASEIWAIAEPVAPWAWMEVLPASVDNLNAKDEK